jgi:DNA polymerase
MPGVGIRGTGDAAPDLARIAAEAARCTRCDLYRRATQTVFGEGPVPARLMLVGEQPGDREDLAGHPFVGPAGRVLDDALGEAGVERDLVYVTNAVKHFKWKPRGKRRIHERPNAAEIMACSGWLADEVAHVSPDVVVALGAVAVRALFGKPLAITSLRGQAHESAFGPPAVVTVHPASIVRIDDADERRRTFEGLVDDLRLAAALPGRRKGRGG